MDPIQPPPSDAQIKEQKIATDIATITTGIAGAITIVSKVNTWSAICGLFTALPGLVQLGLQLMSWIKSISGDNPQAFISNLGQNFALLTAAKTQEERSNAAKKLADSISNLPNK